MKKALNFAGNKIVKSITRHPCTFPGCYDRLGVTVCGDLLCATCIKDNIRLVLKATLLREANEWQIIGQAYEAVGVEVGEESAAQCTHCYREIGELGC